LFPKNFPIILSKKQPNLSGKIIISQLQLITRFLIIIGSIGTLLWNSIRLHRSVRNRELPPDCKRVGIRVWGTLSVFLRKNFVSLCALLFSLAFFLFWVCRCSFPFASAEFLFSESESGAYSSPPERRDRGSVKGKLNGRFYFFWLRYAIRIRDSLFYFGIVKKVKRVEVLGEINYFFGGVGVSSRRNRFKESI
jgi:hypothetical protein